MIPRCFLPGSGEGRRLAVRLNCYCSNIRIEAVDTPVLWLLGVRPRSGDWSRVLSGQSLAAD